MLVTMTLRIPGSGTFLESWLNGVGHLPGAGDDHAVEAVTYEQLVSAVEAMERGDIEYVILENGDEFIQAAGAGSGRFAMQFSPVSGDMEEVRGGVEATTMRGVLLAYHRGDPAWRNTSTWSAM
jgi:hypothetical protein